jgi:Domain of unknown function (DUF4389)
VRLTEDLQLGRRRLAVLLRLPLLLPVAVVAAAWSLIAAAAGLLAWPAALVTGRVPFFVHRTLAAALGYLVQVRAWASLVSGRYPWPRRRSRHPVQLVAPRRRHRRWSVLLRAALALPAVVLASVLLVVEAGTTVGAWFVALVLGRTTAGLRELGAFCIRYETEVAGYLLLLTPRYPRLAPPPPIPEPPSEARTAEAL